MKRELGSFVDMMTVVVPDYPHSLLVTVMRCETDMTARLKLFLESRLYA